MDGLSDLRASIEVRRACRRTALSPASLGRIAPRDAPHPTSRSHQTRIDALEAFYNRHLDDERSLLFEKQRLKLRKLLHEYDAAVAQLGSSRTNPLQQRGSAGGLSAAATAAAALAGSASYGLASPGAPAQTRVIREDSRLTLAETAAWFAQAGAAEMPDLTFACVEKVFGHVTRTNVDGRMSVRDLRQWCVGVVGGGRGAQPAVRALRAHPARPPPTHPHTRPPSAQVHLLWQARAKERLDRE